MTRIDEGAITRSLPEDPPTRAGSARVALLAAAVRGCAVLHLAEPEIRGLRQVVRPSDVCFDVGAGYGMYSYPLAALVGPGGAVHAFEPLSRPYSILRAGIRASGSGHVHPHNLALGDRERTSQEFVLPVRFGLPIHGWAHVGGPGVVSRVWPPGTSSRMLRTRLRAVDGFCAERGIDRIHFMKVDVEGFEPQVLLGARRTIERFRPTLLLEVEERHLVKYGSTAQSVAADLRDKYGYAMYVWRSGEWAPVEQITLARRNYLFATDDAWRR